VSEAAHVNPVDSINVRDSRLTACRRDTISITSLFK